MPLFTAIAGWVYALKPAALPGGFVVFARKKAMRLLVPMIVVGTLYFVIQYLVPGTNNKGDITRMWRIYFFHIPLLVLALAVSYLHDTVVHRSLQKDGKPPPVGGVVCDCHITECGERPRNDARAAQSFQFQGGVGATALFFAGVGACRFAREFRGAGCLVRLSLWVAAFLGVALIQVVWFASAEVAAVAHELYVLTVIATLFLLLEMRVHNRFFVWLGGYAYSIYLFHGFGTAGGRILLKMLGVKAVAVVFPVVTAVASALPVVVDRVAGRYKAARVLLLGKAA